MELVTGAGVPSPFLMPAARGFQFAVLTVAATAVALARFAVMPLQETVRSALSLSDNQIALLVGPAAALPVMLGAIPLGLAVDRYSRVRLLLIFAAVNVAGGLIAAVASSFVVLFVSRCIIGLMGAAIGTTELSLLADMYPPSHRGRARAVLGIGQYAGASLAFAVGGVLLAAFDSASGWRWVMFWLVFPLLLVMLPIFAMREPPRTEVVVSRPSLREGMFELWRYRAIVIPLLLGLALIEISLNAALVWAAPALSRSFALTPSRIGVIMATTMMVSGIFGPIMAGTLADLCQRIGGPRRTISFLSGLAFVSIPAATFAVMPEVAAASVVLVVFITIVAAAVLMGITLFTVVIPNELRGLCFGIFVTVASLSSFAPVMVSLLSGAIGGPTMIGRSLCIVCASSSLLSAITFVCTRRHFPGTQAR